MQTRPFIGGEYVDPLSDRSLTVVNPATEQVLATVPDGSERDVDRAVRSARKALEGEWLKVAPGERAKLIWKLAERLEARREEFARLETQNVGKPITTTLNREVSRAADVLRYFSGWATKIFGSTLPSTPNQFVFTVKEPVGVVGAIVPWNFPLIIAMYKLAPALACGNAIVLKPSEFSPMTALLFGSVCQEAGLPPGVVNVVPGGAGTGQALVDHPDVDKICFTGSVATGQEIMRRCAATLKRVQLELGGKSPNIVFADADLEAAARQSFNGIFYNAGQVCVAGSRLFVERSVRDEMVDRLRERVGQMVVGDPMDETTTLGPITCKRQYDKVMGYVQAGRAEGAKLALGGAAGPTPGYFVQPTIFDDVRPSMKIAQEEIFGPVLCVLPFDDAGEAVEQANASPYGLAAGVWTRDVQRAHRTARRLKAGIVWVNCYYVMDPMSPFGGYKKSGFGRDLGREALDHYLETKTVWMNLE